MSLSKPIIVDLSIREIGQVDYLVLNKCEKHVTAVKMFSLVLENLRTSVIGFLKCRVSSPLRRSVSEKFNLN